MFVSVVSVPLAAVAAVLVGFLWYHPRAFGATWMRAINMTPEMANASRRGTWLRTLVTLLAALFAASMLGSIGALEHINDLIGAFGLALGAWAGFVVPPMLGIVLWERKPFSLFLIDALYWLVALAVMAPVLLYFGTFA